MLTVRNLDEKDQEVVTRMHEARGFDFTLPRIDSPDMLISAGLESEKGIEMVVLLRSTAEAILVVGEAGSRKDRLGKILLMQKELNAAIKRMGLTEAHCWVAPPISSNFGKLLLHIGWEKPLWPCYSWKVK